MRRAMFAIASNGGWLSALALAGVLVGGGSTSVSGQQVPLAKGGAVGRRVPEALNFANGLYRDRRYNLAAEEYKGFLDAAQAGGNVLVGPDGDDGRFGLASSLHFLGRYKEAEAAFDAFLRSAAKDHPNVPTATFRRGEAAYLIADLPVAKASLEAFLAANPGHRHEETAWYHLGGVYLRMDDLPRARKAYETVIARPGSSGPNGLGERAKFNLGRVLAAQGENDLAAKAFTELADGGGADWVDRARFELGKVEAAANRQAEAVAAFEAMEAKSPRSPLIPEERLRRAEALAKLDRREDAEALLKPIAESTASPLAATAADALGASQLARGKGADALATFDEAAARLATSPTAPLLRFHAAEAAKALGRPDARARFLKLAEGGPDDPLADDATLQAAGLALDAKDFADAARLAGSIPEVFPKSDRLADARLVAGRAAIGLGDPKRAVALLEAVLAPVEGQPAPPAATAQAARYYLAIALRADGQAGRAAEMLGSVAGSPTAPAANDAQFMIGQDNVEAGRFADAIPALEKYLAAKPSGEVADYALAHVAHAQVELGKLDEAGVTLEALATRFPASKTLPTTRLRLAEATLGAKSYDRAIALFRAAGESAEPGTKARAQSGLGWSLLGAGKPTEAAAAFEGLVKESPDDPLAPEAALARARALETAKEVDPAIAAYDDALNRYPKAEAAGPAALAKARLLVEAKRPAEAADAFARVEAEYPKAEAPDALLAERGWALVDAGKPAEADAAFGRLMADFPESPHAADARLNLAESAFAAKAYDKVGPLLAPVVAEGSKAKPVLIQSSLYRLARAAVELKEWPAAGASFGRLVAEFPEGSYRREAEFWRAEVAFQAGDVAAAEAGFAAAIASPAGPDDPPGLAHAAERRRAQLLVQLERWKDALDAADVYFAHAEPVATPDSPPADPHAADIDYARGRAYQGLARFDEAREAYARVIEARKGSELAAKAQFMRGEAFFHQKRFPEALREFLKVDYLYDAPTWQASALLEAGKVHGSLDQWAEAAETYERLRTKFPSDPHAAQALPLLEAARKHAEPPTNPPAPGGG